MGKDYKTVQGVVEYCYVKSITTHISVSPTKCIYAQLVFELKDAKKNLVDAVYGKVSKSFTIPPTMADVDTFLANEVLTYINQQKTNYSGYTPS
jgi:hypothetical protein